MSQTILYLEDNPDDAELVRSVLETGGVRASVRVVRTPEQYVAALSSSGIDLVVTDHAVPGFSGTAALEMARRCADVPVIILTGHVDPGEAERCLRAGAVDYLSKDELWRLPFAIKRGLGGGRQAPESPPETAWAELVAVVRELLLARTQEAVMATVRTAARRLTGADGATIVLRDGDACYYADEDAIAPLWKGKRLPITMCVSGWVMLNRRPATIPDIFKDSRVPVDAYRPTFVRSLVMVPIRTAAPLGAIGNYWASVHEPTAEQLSLLQALADTTAAAMENVNIYQGLEHRVRERTLELEVAARELEAFAYSVSHDLRAPVRAVNGFSEMLVELASDRLDQRELDLLSRIRAAGARMSTLIEALLTLSRYSRAPVRRGPVDLSSLARGVLAGLAQADPGRSVAVSVEDGLVTSADPALARVVLENLLGNAWKYTSRTQDASIAVGGGPVGPGAGARVFHVRDNGAGFDPAQAGRLFGAFQRLHEEAEFPGTGVGLATVQRIVNKHGGRVWAEAQPGRGATFSFTLEPDGDATARG